MIRKISTHHHSLNIFFLNLSSMQYIVHSIIIRNNVFCQIHLTNCPIWSRMEILRAVCHRRGVTTISIIIIMMAVICPISFWQIIWKIGIHLSFSYTYWNFLFIIFEGPTQELQEMVENLRRILTVKRTIVILPPWVTRPSR